MPDNKHPLVSVISINYNGLHETVEMIKSFDQVTYPNVEIIIVDNASTEDPSAISKQFPHVTLFMNETNEGFAGGNNRGIEIAKGEYILLLNNDTLVEPGFLEPLIERCQSAERVGIVCPKLVYFEDQNIIQYAGYTKISPITGRGHGIGFNEKDTGKYDTPTITQRAHGAAMFMPKPVIERVGLMAEIYFLYYEEMDYCERIKKAGYNIWYEPQSKIIHKESMSVGKNSLMKTYYLSRNRLLYLRRQVDWPIFFITMLYYTFIAVPKNILTLMKSREWSHLKAYWRGFIWHFKHFKIHNDKPYISKQY